jgi:hypothetical protein
MTAGKDRHTTGKGLVGTRIEALLSAPVAGEESGTNRAAARSAPGYAAPFRCGNCGYAHAASQTRSMNAFQGSVRRRLWLNPAGGGTTATT